MKNRFLVEESTLFISLIKWTFLSCTVGAVIGAAVTGFLMLMQLSETVFNLFNLYWFLPIGLFLSYIVIRFLSPEAEGHGTEKVIEAIHHRSGKISVSVIPVKLIATMITVMTGGSVGKEGPGAQIGAGIASLFADFVSLSDQDRKKLVVCGISAGFAVVFGAPVSGAIFGVEVVFLGHIMYESLYPSLVAGLAAYHVAELLGYRYYKHSTLLVTSTDMFWLKVFISGLVFGVVGIAFIESMKFSEKLFHKINIWAPYKTIIAGSLMLLASFYSGRSYLGIGADQIETALTGEHIPLMGAAWKIFYTSLTLSAGGSGGILTPVFFIGAYTGNIFGHLFNADPATFAAIGFIALLAACANTPIAAIIMAIELFGPTISGSAALASTVSFLIVGYRSAYPSQVLLSIKSPSLSIELGHEIKDTDDLTLNLRKHTVSWQIVRILKKIRRIIYARE